MTGSRSEASTGRMLVGSVAVLLLAACRGGLPPEPPGADAADPHAEVPAYDPGPDPLQRSAFEGVDVDKKGGHAHHHHGHGKSPDAAGQSDAETAEPQHQHDEGGS